MIAHAAESLDLRSSSSARIARQGASLAGAGALMLAASVLAVGSTAYLYQRFAERPMQASSVTRGTSADRRPAATPVSTIERPLPADAALSILVGTYPVATAGPGGVAGHAGTSETVRNVRALADRLETSGYAVYYAETDLGPKGRWQRVFVGAYTDRQIAQRDAERLNGIVAGANARVVDLTSDRAEN
jgi:cell division septation protein DedD